MAYYPEIKTLGDVPRYHSKTQPDKVALVFENRSTTYAEWNIYCNQVANGLSASGCRTASRIGFIGKNSDHYFEVLFGAAKAGAVLVPLNWRLAAREIEYILRDAEIEFLFTEQEYIEKIEAVRESLPSLKQVIVMTGNQEGYVTYDAWRNQQSIEETAIASEPDDVVLQIYTSGTTGFPKGVQLSHRNFYVLPQALALGPNPDDPLWEWNVWNSDDTGLVTMPCFHISGSGWAIIGLYNGACNVVLREFGEEAVLDAIQEHKITKLILVPTAMQMVIQHPKSKQVDFSSLKYMCYGASPIPLGLLRDAIQTFDCQFVQMYGLTETTGAVTFLPAADHDVNGNERMRSAGLACFGVELKVAGEDGKEVPRGETGEIMTRSETIMKGYWNLPEETAQVIGSDGWFRTGDAGYMNKDGYVFLQDRVKDMIVSGGVNIYPAEIESALYSHPGIDEIAVIGVPDEKWGEAVKAIVVPKLGIDVEKESILEFAREQIAGYKIPKSIEFVKELPRNASGKILKREIRKKYWEGQERNIG